MRRTTTLVNALRSTHNGSEIRMIAGHRDGSEINPTSPSNSDEDEEEEEEEEEQLEQEQPEQEQVKEKRTSSRRLRRTNTLVAALRNHDPDNGLRPVHRDGTRSGRAPSVGRRSSRRLSSNQKKPSAAEEEDDDDDDEEPEEPTKPKKTPSRRSPSRRSPSRRSPSRRSSSRLRKKTPPKSKSNASSKKKKKTPTVNAVARLRKSINENKNQENESTTNKRTNPKSIGICFGIILVLIAILLLYFSSHKPSITSDSSDASNSSQLLAALHSQERRMQQLESELKTLKTTLSENNNANVQSTASNLASSLKQQQTSIEQFVAEQIGIAAGKETTLRDKLRTKIVKEQEQENAAKLIDLKKQIIEFLGTKILSASEAGKKNVADLKIVIRSLQTQNVAMFGKDSATTTTNNAKKGGVSSNDSSKGIVETRFDEISTFVTNLDIEQKDFNKDIRKLVDQLQIDLATKTTAIAAIDAAVSKGTSAESSSRIISMQVKSIKQEIEQISKRLDTLGTTHATNSKKEFKNMKKTITLLEKSMKNMQTKQESTDKANKGIKEQGKTVQANVKGLKGLGEALDQQTADANAELKRVSKELTKQNTKTLNQLEQVKKDLEKAMEAFKKKSTDKVAEVAQRTTKPPSTDVVKENRRLDQTDRDLIQKLIETSVTKAINKYKKTIPATSATTNGKITRQMIMEWITNAVDTFGKINTGGVHYFGVVGIILCD